jgi:hypothetical protein
MERERETETERKPEKEGNQDASIGTEKNSPHV